jgi:protein associated with RNAse G/E
MSDNVEVSRDAFEPIALLVKEGLFKNEKEALKSLVLDQAALKIRQFDIKISEMKAKYKVSFEEFKRHIELRRESESFEEWDDFIIWESYESARGYWANVEARLKGQNA